MQRELAYTVAKKEQLEEKQGTIEKQIEALLEEIGHKRSQNEHSLHETYSQLLEHLNVTLAQVKEALLLQSKQVEEKRFALKQMIRERKVIEKIKEKQYAGWRIQAEKSEGSLIENTLKPPHS